MLIHNDMHKVPGSRYKHLLVLAYLLGMSLLTENSQTICVCFVSKTVKLHCTFLRQTCIPAEFFHIFPNQAQKKQKHKNFSNRNNCKTCI